ncbi:putative minor capsid protein [Zamilon virus]|uniref:Putative minor capsid protein n=1 Tax=Zamilon virus TaxID=1411887 RepID=A0A2P1EHJ7_9VIRU|nr:putative minor capsid protein [Zamilon virus]
MSNNCQNSNEPDTVYYDIVIPYNPNDSGLSPATFQAQLTQPLLYNPDKYYLSVVRFSIPTQYVPLMIPEIQPFPNTNVNNTIYSVTLEYNGVFSSQTFVQYDVSLTNPNDTPPPPPTINNRTVEPTAYYYVYNFSPFLQMINKALSDAFAEITMPVGASAPYFVYSPVTQRISLVAQRQFYDRNLAQPIKIYCNEALFPFLDGIPFGGLDFNSVDGRDILFNVENLGNNLVQNQLTAPTYPPEFIQMEQEYATLSNWNAIKTIQLVSNLLPINREFIPSFRNTNVGVVNSQGILADFVPLVTLGPESRTSIDYVANGPWRLIDMFGGVPITMVDLSVYWTDQIGRRFVLDVPRGRIATCKLIFIKKDLAGHTLSRK